MILRGDALAMPAPPGVVRWDGCYDAGWRDLIVPTAFAHPAKMSRGLIVRIFDELFAGGVLQVGDCVVDPFAGIGSTGIEAASRGVRFVGCELEPKFVALARQNFERHRLDWEAMGRPQPVIVQGDSRKLREVIGPVLAECVVSSPPYETDQIGGGGGQKREDKVLRAMMDGYGDTPGQLGSMPPGAVDAVISSPPYAGNAKSDYLLSDDGKTRARDERRGFRQGAGCFRGSEAAYGEADGQLGRMSDDRGIDAIVSSPPFTQGYAGGGGINVKGYGPDGADKVGERTYQGTGAERSDGNLETMPFGAVDAVVSSPPYEGSLKSNTNGTDAAIGSAKRQETGGRIAWGSNADGSRSATGYSDCAAQLGNEHGETFWAAALEIVRESHAILRLGGVAVWVVKHFVRKGQLVDFPGDWRRLCEHVGFETVMEVHASLVTEETTSHLFDGERVTRRERKSFFRRLAEKKGSPRIDFETVLFMHKPMRAAAEAQP